MSVNDISARVVKATTSVLNVADKFHCQSQMLSNVEERSKSTSRYLQSNVVRQIV